MNTRANKLLSTVILLMTVVAVDAQTAPEVPRLVVNIMIDQLRTDYMEAFSPLYSGQGFLRLMKQGHMFSQAEYPFDTPDRASAAACLASGTSPYVNGVVGEVWLDRQTLQPVYCVDDKNFAGSQTSDATSPLYLAVSTLGDELKVSTEGRGMVISIAPNRDAAVLSAGHAADAALWIDDQTGRWCSTTYYGDYPQWATEYEAKSSLSKRIGSITWTPVNESVGNFNYFVSGTAGKPFNHKFSGDRKFREFKASACVNEEVTNFVKQAIKGTTIGMDGVSDLLNVTYYAGNFDHQSVGSYPIEIQDTYVRLDYQIAELINAVENRVGEGKALFVITSSGYADTEDATDLSKYRIPSGTFSISRAQLVLNMYLIAVYGEGQYVEASRENELYLNLKLIEERNLNLAEVLERCSDFLIQLSGVRDVYSSQRLALGAWTPGISKLRNAYNPKCSGDILIQVSPGWTLVNETTHEQIITRESYMGFPLFFFGCKLPAQVNNTPVTVDRVAPTLAKVMRIRAPNACSLAPLPGVQLQQ